MPPFGRRSLIIPNGCVVALRALMQLTGCAGGLPAWSRTVTCVGAAGSPARPYQAAWKVLPLTSEAVDLELDDVSRAQVRLIRPPEGHAGRGAGVNDVARVQGHELAEVPDEVVDREDHVLRAAVLPDLSVDPQPETELLGVPDLIGGQIHGPNGFNVS